MSNFEMTGYERTMAAIKGREFDVVPAVNFTSVVTNSEIVAKHIDFSKAHTDSYLMSSLAATGYTIAGFDSVAPYFSVLLEAEGLGARINWGSNEINPFVEQTAFPKLEDISVPNDFLSRKPFQQLLRAIHLLKKKFKGQVAVIGKVVGPWTLAYNVYGAEKLTLDMILDPINTKKKINELSAIPIAFALAQFEAGADIITWAEHATRDLVSTQIYEDFIYPIHKKATEELKQYGPVVLHICGNIEDRFSLIAKSGFDCIHIDSRNNLALISEKAKNKIKLASCINNPVTLLRGSHSQLRKEINESIINGISMIGPECALPTTVPIENLQLLTKVAHSYNYEDFLRISRNLNNKKS